MTKIRVGQRDRAGRKLIGYNVYYAPDGCCPEFYGFAKSLRAARSIARGRRLEASLWDTARAAGHCAGLYAPEGVESDEPVAWFGRGGWDCAVAVWQ